jgi:hypothetical protein
LVCLSPQARTIPSVANIAVTAITTMMVSRVILLSIDPLAMTLGPMAELRLALDQISGTDDTPAVVAETRQG